MRMWPGEVPGKCKRLCASTTIYNRMLYIINLNEFRSIRELGQFRLHDLIEKILMN